MRLWFNKHSDVRASLIRRAKRRKTTLSTRLLVECLEDRLTPSGSPANIMVISGAGQSATVNTAFANPVVAEVTDSLGTPVSGVIVTFAAPGSGASATFPAGALVTTDVNGMASDPIAANTIAGTYSITASAAGVSSPATFAGMINTADNPTAIASTSGSGQSTTVNTAFANQLVATVTDQFGNAVSGVVVTFAAPGSGASATFPGGTSVITDVNGLASAPITANTIAGTYSITASAAGTSSAATFAGMINAAGSPTAIAATSGSGQSTVVNTAFTNPLVATVTDQFGNAVSGVTVTFAAPGSGASATFPGGTSVITDVNGLAGAPITANTIAGTYSITASAAGTSSAATFAGMINAAGSPTAIAATSGSGQSTVVNTAFTNPLVATVTDQFGNAVSGVTVTFAAPGSGASATFPGGTSVITDVNGLASAPITANTIAGTYSITASAAGVSTPATFTSLTNDLSNSNFYFMPVTNTGIALTASGTNDSVEWTDVNGDGRPDLWIGTENRSPNSTQQSPGLYINNGDGTFTSAFATAFPPGNPLTKINDAEGSAWGDVFNTGTADFLQVSGGVGAKHFPGSYFFVNRQGQLTDEAPADNLTNTFHGGRAGTFLDWNHDGLLDPLFLNYTPFLTQTIQLYQQTPIGFDDITNKSGLTTNGIKDPVWAQSVDLNGDGVPDLVIGPSDASGQPPVVFLGNKNSPGYTLAPKFLPSIKNITDMAVGDFFNNGSNEILFTRRLDNQSDVEQGSPTQIGAHLVGSQDGFSFQTTGSLTFEAGLGNTTNNTLYTDQIFIGSQGYNPTSLPFTLDPNDPANQGIVPHDQVTSRGLYIGYDPGSQTWSVYNGAQGTPSPFILNASQPATNLTPIGFDPNNQALAPVFLVYNPTTGKYTNMTTQAGLATPIPGSSVVAGDFNNDGLLDLYVSTENSLADRGGILYLNGGNGTFTAVAGAPSNPGVFFNDVENGGGRRAIMADYNGDGTLDLFTPNTLFQTPANNYYASPNEILYNTPNGNNWVEFNLQGVESNRGGLGAVVYLTAGGITQRRDVTGGNHIQAQNSNIVHFGLGHNTTIDQVVIDWPSGIVQTLTNVPVDVLQTILEPGGHSMAQSRPVTIFSPNQTYSGSLDAVNTQDFYSFTSGGPANILLTLSGQAQILLLDQNGNALATSQLQNGQQELSVPENQGTFYVEVFITGSDQSGPYTLQFNNSSQTPLISNLVITPLSDSTPPITIIAAATLANPGNHFIAGAEFFIDSTGANGTGIPLAAQDGSFDEASENIIGTIDGQLWNSLRVKHHAIFIHAVDDQGNWGAFVSVVFLKDNLGPLVSQLTVTPEQSTSPPTISARVSDKKTGVSKIMGAEYFIDTPGNPGTGTAMTVTQQFDGGVIRVAKATIDSTVFSQLSAGQHTVFMEGEDILGNWGPLVSATFTIVSPGLSPDLAAGPWGGMIDAKKPVGNPDGTVLPDYSNSATYWRHQIGMWGGLAPFRTAFAQGRSVTLVAAIPGSHRHFLDQIKSALAPSLFSNIEGLGTPRQNE